MKGWYKRIYRHCRDLIFPHNVIKLKTLPRGWSDTDSKIEAFLELMLDDFITKERCFEVVDWDHNDESKQLKKEMLEAQEWFKEGRAVLQKEVEEIMEELFGGDWEDLVKFLNTKKDPVKLARLYELEEEIEKTNTKHYVWIVVHRASLWT